MIVYDLICRSGHRFEGWFASSLDFDDQRRRGLIACPNCGADQVEKAPMAPAVPRKANQIATSPVQHAAALPMQRSEATKALLKLAEVQAEVLKNSRWVGTDFATQSREMHYGERDSELIHGRATLHEAQELLEEGIAVMPLLAPVAAPEELN